MRWWQTFLMALLCWFGSGCGLVRQYMDPDLRTLVYDYGAGTVPGQDHRVFFRTTDDDRFALAFRHLTRYGGVHELAMRDTDISDQSISLLLQLRDLRKLDVTGTQVSAEGLKRLRLHPRLEVLVVGRMFSEEELQDLQNALPEVNILGRGGSAEHSPGR